MEFILENERNIPVAADFDVAVCGGGIAGIAAAVSAAALAADDKADADGVINVLRKRGVPLHIDEVL